MLSRRGLTIVTASSLVQLALVALPDTMGDLLQYRSWTRTLVREGLAAAYWPEASAAAGPFDTAIDYPPLIPYLFWFLGHALEAGSPGALERAPLLVETLLRVPFCLAGLLLALLVHAEARRLLPAAADLALAALAWNPALLFDTVYWGQADAVCALLVALALVTLVRGRPEWAAVALAAALLAKPLALPFAPLVALETFKRFGPRRTLTSGAAAAATVAVALVPFAAVGRLGPAVAGLVSQLDAMPYVSVNAHNLWWLVQRGTPWLRASDAALGPFSWAGLGLMLFGSFYALTIARLWRSAQPSALYVAAASTALGFFGLLTHMHENHLFLAIPLFALAALVCRPARVLVLALTLTLLGNMLLHDPLLTHLVRPHVPGAHLLLSPTLEPQATLVAQLTSLGHPWIAEKVSGETTLLGTALTLLNAQANVLLLAAWLCVAYRGRDFEGPFTNARLPRAFFVLAPAFVLLTGVPFVAHTLGFPG